MEEMNSRENRGVITYQQLVQERKRTARAQEARRVCAQWGEGIWRRWSMNGEKMEEIKVRERVGKG